MMRCTVPFALVTLVLVVSAGCGAPPVIVPPQQLPRDVDMWPPRPQVNTPVQAVFPQAQTLAIRKTAAGAGADVIVIVRHDLPIVHLRWVIPGGRMLAWTPDGDKWPEGTLSFAQQVAMMGTVGHPGTALAMALGDLGASVELSALGDAVLVEASVLSHQLPKLMPLLREMLLQPQFDKNDIESVRRRMGADLRAELGDPEAIARRLALRIAFGPGHPYGSEGPTLASLPKIDRKQLLAAWAAATRLGGSTLAAVGDVEPAQLAQLVEREFGAALETVPLVPQVPLPQAVTGDTCHVVHVPGAVQMALQLVNPGPPRRTKAWPALVLANQVIGGSASARLFVELREKRGLTYGIYSGFDARRTAGRWMVQGNVRNEVAGEALAAIDDLLLAARRTGPPDQELTAAKRLLSGQFALALADGSALVEYLAAVPLYGLPADEFSNYNDRLQQVGADQVLEATVLAVATAGGRVTVLAGDVNAARPGLDMACRRIVLDDDTGKQVKVLLGSDEDMGDTGRAEAFAAWMRAPSGLVALARYASQSERAPAYRAQALALAARGKDSGGVLAIGRAATDWRTVALDLVPRLVAALHDPDSAVQKRAHALLLAMANDVGADGKLGDVDVATASGARRAVAEWGFADVDGTKTPDAIGALADARLDPGDLAKLGDACGEVLEHWIANDVRRHEAATALLQLHGDVHLKALVRGYRRLFAYGIAPVEQDLVALGQVPGVDALVLLLDVHALVQGSDMPHAVTRTVAIMRTSRELLAKLAETPATDGAAGKELAVHYDRVEGHIENLLAMRNADDRWLAIGLMARYRGVLGLRRALQGMADDDHYRVPRWHTTDPRRMAALLAKGDIVPLGPNAEPSLLAALAAPKPIGKVIAVAGLKASGTNGALAALRTCTDETEISAYLDLPPPLTVRDLALAAVDVIKMHREVDAKVKAGTMSAESAAIYKEISYFTAELADKRLREEVHRQVMARTQAMPVPQEATPPAIP